MSKKWVKMPSAGQFRGEGEWVELERTGYSEAEWSHLADTGFLPVHEGDEPPEEDV